jgi:hypothetical protein
MHVFFSSCDPTIVCASCRAPLRPLVVLSSCPVCWGGGKNQRQHRRMTSHELLLALIGLVSPQAQIEPKSPRPISDDKRGWTSPSSVQSLRWGLRWRLPLDDRFEGSPSIEIDPSPCTQFHQSRVHTPFRLVCLGLPIPPPRPPRKQVPPNAEPGQDTSIKTWGWPSHSPDAHAAGRHRGQTIDRCMIRHPTQPSRTPNNTGLSIQAHANGRRDVAARTYAP